MSRFKAALFLCLLLKLLCFAKTSAEHYLFLGPEFYHAKRMKNGKTQQTGWLFGGRGIYERRRCNGFYWSVDSYYACGTIEGQRRKFITSELTDCQIEGNIGYSFFFNCFRKFSVLPFVGYGYFKSVNHFKKPSPLLLEFRNDFNYSAFGVEILFCPKNCLKWGVNFKIKYMIEGKSRVKDPDFDNVTLLMQNEKQYELDLPIRYCNSWKNKQITAVLAPFYRLRHYGGRQNWPNDFIDTKFKIYGIRCLVDIFF